ncbi:MAG: PspC domain-containing protein [Sphaerochaetaceae bacterium]|nr:PspC domain-containing protein [Sphaerochaetaceae bacterium]
MATKRLYRSRKADLLGVCHGIAEWRDLPVGGVQLAFILVGVFTAVLPCLAIYLLAAIILPVNPNNDDMEEQNSRYYKGKDRTKQEAEESARERYTSGSDDINERFERLKKKVYDTEAKVEDAERKWDDKFYGSSK